LNCRKIYFTLYFKVLSKLVNMSKEQLDNLSEIRNLMERSSRFLSLSGLSGISAGLFALAGAVVAYVYLGYDQRYFDINRYFQERMVIAPGHSIGFLLADALVVLIMAIAAGLYFTSGKAKKRGLRVWDKTAKRLMINLFIPLVAGGLFCLILLYHGIFFLVAPLTLLFYGLALFNAGKYTLPEVRYLGISEIALGLTGSVFAGYGLIIWAFGFGILHIIYGTFMYWKYDREVSAK